MPRRLVEAISKFLNVSAVVFLCSYDLNFENQFCFYGCKSNIFLDLNQINLDFLRKKIRKRLRDLRKLTGDLKGEKR